MKTVFIMSVLALTIANTQARTINMVMTDNVLHGDGNVITNADKSVNIGWGDRISDVTNTNSIGSSNTLTTATDTNVNGISNNVENTTGTSAMGNSNTIKNSENSQVLGNNNNLTGNNNIAIGNGNTVSGENSIALGGGTASNGGISIGSGSSANRADEVNFGDRQLTGIKAGVADTDAVNVGQLNSKADETLQNANDYTDSRVPTIINEANEYTNNQYNQAIDQLFQKNRGYIDGQINRLDKKIDNYRDDAFAGVAGAMAIASIPKKEGYKTSYGVGVANYRNQQAIAAGIEHNTSPKTVIKFNFSSDTKGGIGLGAGFAVGH